MRPVRDGDTVVGMKPVDPTTLDVLWHDADAREVLLRKVVAERLAAVPPPSMDEHVVATYFLAFRTMDLRRGAEHIVYYATSGEKDPPPDSLLRACTGDVAGVDAFDASGRIGLVHVGYPLEMMLDPRGRLTSCDLLHLTASAIVFDVYEQQDARLIGLRIPDEILQTFPGPAHGARGIRGLTGLPDGQPAFGTILKPTAGLTPEQVGDLVAQAAECPLFVFVKEDENFLPNLPYAPAAERTRRAVEAIRHAADRRGGAGLIFAPHVSGPPHEILDTVDAVLDAGAKGVMFSETFAGGTVRMVREATKSLDQPPAIYGHNAGIGVKTRAIWREVIDLLARLDGIDFRQTAPIRPGPPFLRPYGAEFLASEEILTRPLPGIRPTVLVRAGGLDQGSIGLNLAEAEGRGLTESILYLAGSAINSIKGADGRADPRMGAEAMVQAVEIHRTGELSDTPAERHVAALGSLAERKRLGALREALRQRYPRQVP